QLYLVGIVLSPVLGGLSAIPAGLVAGGLALWLLSFSCNLPLPPLFARGRTPEPDDDDPDYDDLDDPEVGGRFQPIGALVHGWFSLRARLRRLTSRPQHVTHRFGHHDDGSPAVRLD